MSQEKPECVYHGCKRKPLKSSKNGYCIFHAKAEDKDEREFKEALKKYLKKRTDYNFIHFIFAGDIDFERDFKVTLFKNACFWETEFRGNTYFGEARFQGDTNLNGARFQGDTDFRGAEFRGNAYFRGAEFQGDTDFRGAEFLGNADFREARFQGDTDFREAEFLEYSEFNEARFLGNADFREALFQGDADFREAEFRTRAFICPKFVKRLVLFGNTILENISLTPLNLDEKAQIDFTGTRLRNTQIKRKDIEGHIMQEQNKDFFEAKEIYLLLKNNFHTLGRYDEESWAFLQEKEMERRSFWCPVKELQVKGLGKKWKNRGLKDCFYPAIFYSGRIAKYLWDFWLPTSWKNTKELAFSRTKSFRRPLACVRAEFKNLVSSIRMNEEEKSRRKVDLSWKEILKALLFYLQSPRYKSARKYFKSTFLKWLYGWGEKPWLIFIWCGLTIFIFSGLYCFIGDVVTATNATMEKSYLEKLYFSGITFTTLGFGGYSTIGGAKALAFIESFLGIFSIALFVYSFARRTAGR